MRKIFMTRMRGKKETEGLQNEEKDWSFLIVRYDRLLKHSPHLQ